MKHVCLQNYEFQLQSIRKHAHNMAILSAYASPTIVINRGYSMPQQDSRAVYIVYNDDSYSDGASPSQ